MRHHDRLSALISRFALSVSEAEPGTGNLWVSGDENGEPDLIRLRLRGDPASGANDTAPLLEASVTWGGDSNPLVAALPASVSMAVDGETASLVRLLLAEAKAARCGSGVVLSRLAEVLVIRLLRAEIERGSTAPGLVAGLADPRLSRAIVAIHQEPGRPWSNEDLAEAAGMSRSRFADAFRARVGETPQSYLRRWRMTLAYQDLDRGHRVQAVARRYGYASSEALARAFQRQYGLNPLAVRSSEAGRSPARERPWTHG